MRAQWWIFVAIAVLLLIHFAGTHERGAARLRHLSTDTADKSDTGGERCVGNQSRRGADAGNRGTGNHHTDSAQFLAFVIAQLESGENIRTILESAAGRVFALPEIQLSYVVAALGGTASTAECGRAPHESAAAERGVENLHMSKRILMCIQLSQVLGCSLAQTLRVLLRVYRHEQNIEGLRAKAFSTPRATVKLLTALPVITLLGGEFLGAHSFSFLFGSVPGAVCLFLGLLFFSAGLVWMSRLMHNFSARGTAS